MKIVVTQKHIDAGSIGCRACPIALAYMESTGHECSVGNLSVSDWENDTTRTLPIEAQNFIFFFDHGKPVQPFTFELK